MIVRPRIPLTILMALLTIFPVGKILPPAQSAISPSTHSETAPIVVAKTATSGKRRSSTITVKNVRHHNHKKYTRVVLDLPARAIIHESKNADTATIALAKSRLSKRALRKIRHRKFPKAITIKEGKAQTVKIILDLKSLRKFTLQTLKKPNRVVVDLFYTKKNIVADSKKKATPVLKSQKPSNAQPTIHTKKSSPAKSQKKKIAPKLPASVQSATPSAKPKASKKKIAKNVPIKPKPQKKTTPVETGKPTPKPAPRQKSETTVRTQSTPPVSPQTMAKHTKDLVVVIDPGHGGKDPGAIGKKGTREKDVTLKIGKYLRDLIQDRLGSRVILTRKKDVFLDLEKRVEFANRNKADLFISIHVNSHPQQKIKGLEVYHFGKASDPRALEVAARENGMKLENDAPPWQFIIADKLNDQKIEQSQTLAWTTNTTLVKTLKTSYKIKDHGVKTAPFYVLRFTTMPSILAEVAFVSNPDEEKRLRTKTFQKKLAEGIYKGIQSYLKTALPTLS